MRALTAALLLSLVFGCGDERTQLLVRRREKINQVRAIVTVLSSRQPLPMKDGALDVYALVRGGDIPAGDFDPGDVKRSDYRSFPYERYRGSAELHGRYPVPLLWDKEPDAEGILIVGMSDGVVKMMYRADFAREFGG